MSRFAKGIFLLALSLVVLKAFLWPKSEFEQSPVVTQIVGNKAKPPEHENISEKEVQVELEIQRQSTSVENVEEVSRPHPNDPYAALRERGSYKPSNSREYVEKALKIDNDNINDAVERVAGNPYADLKENPPAQVVRPPYPDYTLRISDLEASAAENDQNYKK